MGEKSVFVRHLIELPFGSTLTAIELKLNENAGKVSAVAYSPDNRFLAIGSHGEGAIGFSRKGSVELWKVEQSTSQRNRDDAVTITSRRADRDQNFEYILSDSSTLAPTANSSHVSVNFREWPNSNANGIPSYLPPLFPSQGQTNTHTNHDWLGSLQ
jgi:hypothetical protein